MFRIRPILLSVLLLGITTNGFAQAPQDLEALPAPLPPPDPVEGDEGLEPEVTIIQRDDATVEEYRANGVIYMVKITPNIGKPYYFIDRDGDGLMETRMSDLYNPWRVPQWVIFSW